MATKKIKIKLKQEKPEIKVEPSPELEKAEAEFSGLSPSPCVPVDPMIVLEEKVDKLTGMMSEVLEILKTQNKPKNDLEFLRKFG